jgi:branched-chain amino acid transport system substrate-binding protein
LTLGANAATAPVRPFKSYFRVATTDLEQGPFGARYLIGEAGEKNIAVIDDGKTCGAGPADRAAMEIAELGGKVVAREKAGLPTAKAFTDGPAAHAGVPDANGLGLGSLTALGHTMFFGSFS